MNKRIILVGPTASGKTFARKRWEEKGFQCDVSYTTRDPRPEDGEIHGVHYQFISKEIFEVMIQEGSFYEWVEYDGNYYGTGIEEWETLPLFIMETDGLKHITPADRKNCFIIYFNPSRMVRQGRMKEERGWSHDKIMRRTVTDHTKFNGFTDYDMMITNPDF